MLGLNRDKNSTLICFSLFLQDSSVSSFLLKPDKEVRGKRIRISIQFLIGEKKAQPGKMTWVRSSCRLVAQLKSLYQPIDSPVVLP